MTDGLDETSEIAPYIWIRSNVKSPECRSWTAASALAGHTGSRWISTAAENHALYVMEWSHLHEHTLQPKQEG
jgi:hypothetical protein